MSGVKKLANFIPAITCPTSANEASVFGSGYLQTINPMRCWESEYGIGHLFFEVVVEGSNAEVGQLIAGIKFASFLTPDMASKMDARHGIG